MFNSKFVICFLKNENQELNQESIRIKSIHLLNNFYEMVVFSVFLILFFINMPTVSVTTLASSTPINLPYCVAFDSNTSNTFVTNYWNNTICQIDSNGISTILTLTGPNTINYPTGITVDSLGNLYVANSGNDSISKLEPLITPYTYSCTTLTLTGPNTINYPQGITIDSLGNLYVVNQYGSSVSKIERSGSGYSCTTLTLTGGTLFFPQGITIDSLGNLYVANYHSISKLVNSGTPYTYSCTNLTLTGGTLDSPKGITIDSLGNLYVANQSNFTSDSSISKLVIQSGSDPIPYTYSFTNLTLTGPGTLVNPIGITIDLVLNILYVANSNGNSVSKIVLSGNNGTISTAAIGTIFSPIGIVFNSSDNLYITNSANNSVSQIFSNGTVTQLNLTSGSLNYPSGITVDSTGNLYVVNQNGNSVSKIELSGGSGYSCTNLNLVGPNTLKIPIGITIDSLGNLYVANQNGISKLVPLQMISPYTYSCTTLTLTGNTLLNPQGITIDSLGNLYVTDNGTSISKLVVNSGTTYSCTTLTLTGENLYVIRGITIDSDGNLYVGDSGDGSIKRIVLETGTTNGTVSYYVTGLNGPYGVAFNSLKYLYIANSGSSSVSVTTSPSCFNHDTKILCLNSEFQEQYLPIQDLRKGDIVKTYLHGYRKIHLIGKGTFSNKPIWNESMYRMVKTDTNGLFEDLIVTGGHGILVDKVTEEQENAYEPMGIKGFSEKIDDKFILLSAVSDQFIQLTDNDIYTYYHLVPENDGDDNKRFGIWANGILSETPSKNQFLMHKHYEEI